MTDLINEARRWYAEELRFTAHVKSQPVIDAFAGVPRERFVGPGPWRIRSPAWRVENAAQAAGYWTTEDADPRHVYHDVLIALDEVRGINNGQPSLWARLFDWLAIAPGERVLHLGCGTGYYTAIAAELAGCAGRVTAIEIDPQLAAPAREALAPWPQASVVNADASTAALDPADVIIASAGATHPLPAWLDALAPRGRLLLPMTGAGGWGGMLLITRQPTSGYAARFLRPAGFIDFRGARDPEIARRLAAALLRDRGVPVKSLRRAPEEPDDTCWLAGDGWWLSTAAVETSRQPGA
ncbi:MAG TPA: methyltransferase domain-containing protein [Stellaceae bacterium]|jgi:protein-L-isoaspartate(D-aspartate) O-methyltransferase